MSAQVQVQNQVFVIPEISSDRKYWFVRTEGGAYFDEFYFDKFIGIGWNDFDNIKYIQDVDLSDFKSKLKEKHSDEERPGLACGQMKRFITEMKIGDIVMIPSTNSERIAFGTITSEPYISEEAGTPKVDDEEDLIRCNFKKRRDIEWIDTYRRDRLDPYLFRMMYAHNTISDATVYAPFIDRMLYPIYVKDGVGHLVFHVNRKENIPARSLAKLIDQTLGLLDECPDVDTDSVDVKINVQSPGPIEFIAATGIIFLLAAVMHYIVGGKMQLKITKDQLDGKIESEGLIEKWLKHKKQDQSHEVELMKLMGKLEVQLPPQIRSKENKPED